MNPLVEEIVTVIVNRVSEQVLLKVNESLDAKIKALIPESIPAGADGKFSDLQEQVIKDIAIAATKEAVEQAIDDAEIDNKVAAALEEEIGGDLESRVTDIVRDMSFTVDVR